MAPGSGTWLVRILASLALLLFGALAMASGIDRMSLSAPALARLVPVPLQAQAARSAATLAIAQEQPERAVGAARRAVAADPVEPASTSLLATAYLFNGQPEEAEAAFRVAARFGWREPATQVYWYEAAMESGDLPRAVDRADALLRTHPNLPMRDEVLSPLESTAAGRAALIVRMADRPNWLHEYLNPETGIKDDTFDRRSQVLADLAEAGTRLGCQEVTAFVTMALTRGARGNAERVWTGHCPGASLTGGLADGGFERFGRDETSPFGWRSNLSGDVSVRSVEKASGNRALALLNRSAVSRLVLRQAVALAPGTYRLTGAATPGRIAASLGCGTPPPVPSLTDGDPAGTGQVLRVERCARLELGLWIRPGAGEAELDSVALEKIG
jgi:tetratricopeptide (TPR) repeat protein